MGHLIENEIKNESSNEEYIMLYALFVSRAAAKAYPSSISLSLHDTFKRVELSADLYAKTRYFTVIKTSKEHGKSEMHYYKLKELFTIDDLYHCIVNKQLRKEINDLNRQLDNKSIDREEFIKNVSSISASCKDIKDNILGFEKDTK